MGVEGGHVGDWGWGVEKGAAEDAEGGRGHGYLYGVVDVGDYGPAGGFGVVGEHWAVGGKGCGGGGDGEGLVVGGVGEGGDELLACGAASARAEFAGCVVWEDYVDGACRCDGLDERLQSFCNGRFGRGLVWAFETYLVCYVCDGFADIRACVLLEVSCDEFCLEWLRGMRIDVDRSVGGIV